MSESIFSDGWRLDDAVHEDMDQIITWFPDSDSTRIWGGPRFCYPFTRKTFLRDCHWGKMDSFCLRSPDQALAAFGQLSERLGRTHMARLVVSPDCRGQGVGRRLIGLLMQAGRSRFTCAEYSLFVYRHNEPAIKCYKSMGFEVSPYPPEAPMADECYYLTRPVHVR